VTNGVKNSWNCLNTVKLRTQKLSCDCQFNGCFSISVLIIAEILILWGLPSQKHRLITIWPTSVGAMAGPQAWNIVPPARCSTFKSFSTFKKELNHFFLDCHFVYDNVYVVCIQRSSNSSYHKIAPRRLLYYITLHI